MVATRVAGVPRLVEHAVNGLLIDASAPEQLSAALERLLGDAELRTRLAGAARQTVEQRYSFAARMEKIRTIYDRLLP